MTKSINVTNLSGFALPNCLLYTRKLHVPFISHDIFESIPHLPSVAFIGLNTIAEKHKIFEAFNDTLSKFTHMDKKVFLFQNDPVDNLLKSAFNDKEISVWGVGGRLNLTIQKYAELLSCTHPDLVQTPVDNDTLKEEHASLNKKRTLKAVVRTSKYLEEFKARISDKQSMFLSLTGGNIPEVYEKSKSFLDKNFDGLILDGIHFKHSDSPENDKIFQMIKNILSNYDKFVMLPSVFQPGDILKGISVGISLFDGSLPYRLSRAGLAWIYSKDAPSTYLAFPNSQKFFDNSKENFFDEPIQKDCTCFSCKNHNIAYLNHLHEVNEMLGQILLMIHNSTVTYEFFHNAREAISSNSLDNFLDIHKDFYFPLDLVNRDFSSEKPPVVKKKREL